MIVKARKTFAFVSAMSVFLGACSDSHNQQAATDHVTPAAAEFAYISVDDNRIATLHELKFELVMDEAFRATQPLNRVDRFNDTPYQISIAAFIGEDSSLMIHAEKVADSSGASDYSHLPLTNWPDDSFRSGDPVCLEIPAEEVEGEHDLLWLRENGFEPSGSIVFAQYFATTADMNSEIVLSILQRVASCADSTAHSEIIAEFQAKVSVTRVE